MKSLFLCITSLLFITTLAVAAGQDTVANAFNPATSGFPNYHPLVVHFPIVLLLAAAFFQLLTFWNKNINIVVLLLLAGGFAGSFLASEILDAHIIKGISPEARADFSMHHQYASYTEWLSAIALVLKLVSFFFLKSRKMIVEALVTVVLIASAVTVSVAGHEGSKLVHVDGIGPQGKFLRTK